MKTRIQLAWLFGDSSYDQCTQQSNCLDEEIEEILSKARYTCFMYMMNDDGKKMIQ